MIPKIYIKNWKYGGFNFETRGSLDYLYTVTWYNIMFVNVLHQVCDFLWVLLTNKSDRHNTTEILLKVALNTITNISIYQTFKGHNSRTEKKW